MPYQGPVYIKSENPSEFSLQLQWAKLTEFEDEATHLSLTESSFEDPGDDWCRYDLYNEEELIKSVTRTGY